MKLETARDSGFSLALHENYPAVYKLKNYFPVFRLYNLAILQYCIKPHLSVLHEVTDRPVIGLYVIYIENWVMIPGLPALFCFHGLVDHPAL